jgi:hypothetical protein
VVGERAGNTGRGAGPSGLRGRGGEARQKRSGWGRKSRACESAPQVILGIGVLAGEAGTAQAQHGLDLEEGAAAQQALCNPQIGDAPIRRRKALRD